MEEEEEEEEETVQHFDGPLDRRIDISHLRDGAVKIRRSLYDRWTVSGGQTITAAGQLLNFKFGRGDGEENVNLNKLTWNEDGQVSVAKTSCQRCSEINSCRKEGQAPFICLIRADDRYVKGDGTTCCALCYCEGKSQACKATKASEEDTSTDSATVEYGLFSQHASKSGTLNSRKRPFRLSSTEDESSDLEENSDSSDDDDEDDDGPKSRSGRPIKPIIRLNGSGASIRASSSSRRTATVSSSITSSPKGRPAKKFSRTTDRSSTIGKTPTKQINEAKNSSNAMMTSKSNNGEICSKEAKEKPSSSSKDSNTTSHEKAREIRKRCIKTANQLLALELAELEDALKESKE